MNARELRRRRRAKKQQDRANMIMAGICLGLLGLILIGMLYL